MPLAGLTVLDIASLGAAPQIAAFLGDFGARVIKVEPPGGDPLRQLKDAQGLSLSWKMVNRNKECVTLDLTRSAGQMLLMRMLELSDVLVCGHSPLRLRRLGLEPETVRERFPNLFMVNLTLWGAQGPWAERGGSGTQAEAASGLAALTGDGAGPPGLSPVGLGDTMGVQQGIIAVLLGLYARSTKSHGRGGTFDIAMYEPLVKLLGPAIATADRDGVDPARNGNRFATMAPRNTYSTVDGRWVALSAGSDALVARLFELMGQPELVDDPRFASNAARVEHAEELDALIGAWIGARPCAEVVEAFASARVSLAAVDGPVAVASNPHFAARRTLQRVQDSQAGSLLVPAAGPQGSDVVGRIHNLGGEIGADNEAVYGGWLKLSSQQRESLAADGVI